MFNRIKYKSNGLNPFKKSIIIIFKYLIMGCLWILLSDKLLSYFVKNHDLMEKIQLYKGWFYVFITGFIFYLIIKKALSDYAQKAEELSSEKDLLKKIIEEAPGIIIITDKDGRIINFNPYAEKITGFKSEEVLGKAFTQEPPKNILFSTRDIYDKEGNINGRIYMGTDITERMKMEEHLEYIAYFDQFTGLPNRTYLQKEVNEAILKGKKFAIVNLDVDDFKNINETAGHEVGDLFLEHFSLRLKTFVKEGDVLVRLSGDQYAIMFNYKEEEELRSWATEFIEKIKENWICNAYRFYISVSAGIAIYKENQTDFTKIMQDSEIAMFYKKDHGKSGYVFYEENMSHITHSAIKLGNDLIEAINNNDFKVYYQPQIDLKTMKLIGAEALIRWEHKERGFISPGEFIPFAEKAGLIMPITEFVIKKVVEDTNSWFEKYGIRLKIAINFSGYLISEEENFKYIYNLLKNMNIVYENYEIEVTETAVMMDLEHSKKALLTLTELGFLIAMDDFGTGYSSLNYLQKLPFDVLKIDKSFLKEIMDKKETLIYKTVIELAHSMGLMVVAEGVETLEQVEFIKDCKCDIGQGYYYYKPLTQEDFEKILQSN